MFTLIIDYEGQDREEVYTNTNSAYAAHLRYRQDPKCFSTKLLDDRGELIGRWERD